MDPIARLISHFTKFPGVGNKSARRMVFYLLKQDAAQLRALSRMRDIVEGTLRTELSLGGQKASLALAVAESDVTVYFSIF